MFGIEIARFAQAAQESSDLGVAEWAGILGACFAAVAAIAALATVLQNRAMLAGTLRPFLYDAIVRDQERPVLEVHNAGGGVALAVRMLWVHERQCVHGDLITAIESGGYATAIAALPNGRLEDSHGVMVWSDARDNHYAASFDSHYARRPARWWHRETRPQPSVWQAYEQFYGQNVEGTTEVEWRLGRPPTALLGYEPFS